ncbi:hypothetical protein QBC44DRAFT_388556 [Cladorrhinum sp. PSN332]|nr:hypothetical protein QBC44DRAFT_388556 [Cladorrhinum sp. PSN332]
MTICWFISDLKANFTPEVRCCFTDGRPVDHVRGSDDKSYRLVIESLGIIDFTEVPGPIASGSWGNVVNLDINGAALWCPETNAQRLALSIELSRGDHFEVVGGDFGVAGILKPIPSVELEDIAAIRGWMRSEHIPYQNIPDAPGRTYGEIKTKAFRLFPFQDYAQELGMCVYDWTSPSFLRMELLKVFEYTGCQPQTLLPLDEDSLAYSIWRSSWGTYNPQNEDYMHSFMMRPSTSLEDVRGQLSRVVWTLHRLSDTENRVLSAALDLLPRAPVSYCPQLFSGQSSTSEVALDRFGVYFRECPLNGGPSGTTLAFPFDEALRTFLAPGRTITSKCIIGFTDVKVEAMQHSNGILLVLNPKKGSAVWDAPYITPLSADPNRNEYAFKPGTRFRVQAHCRMVNQPTGKPTMVITLQAL